MTYLVTYKFNNGPEESIEIDALPRTKTELQLTIQQRRDESIVIAGTTTDNWNAAHSTLIEIISTKKL